MQPTSRFLPSAASGPLRGLLAGLVIMTALAFSATAHANPGKAAADREFAQAVEFFKEGRRAHAFGSFIALANRGDVDAARIALFMHQYGALLYGTHWEAGRDDVEYWTNLVRNSTTAGRPAPDFTPLAVVAKSKQVKQVRARSGTRVMGNQ